MRYNKCNTKGYGMKKQIRKQTEQTLGSQDSAALVKDIADLSPEMKALFDQAAKNQGFENIQDLANSGKQDKST